MVSFHLYNIYGFTEQKEYDEVTPSSVLLLTETLCKMGQSRKAVNRKFSIRIEVG